jgi:hypothetical protein
VASDLRERTLESRRALEAVRRRLAEVAAGACRPGLAAGSEAGAADLLRLASLRAEVDDLVGVEPTDVKEGR